MTPPSDVKLSALARQQETSVETKKNLILQLLSASSTKNGSNIIFIDKSDLNTSKNIADVNGIRSLFSSINFSASVDATSKNCFAVRKLCTISVQNFDEFKSERILEKNDEKDSNFAKYGEEEKDDVPTKNKEPEKVDETLLKNCSLLKNPVSKKNFDADKKKIIPKKFSFFGPCTSAYLPQKSYFCSKTIDEKIFEKPKAKIRNRNKKSSKKKSTILKIKTDVQREEICARFIPFDGIRKARNWFAFYAHPYRKETPIIQKRNNCLGADRKFLRKIRNAQFEKLSAAMNYRIMLEKPISFRVARSTVHGVGVFANENIQCGQYLLEYKGELIRNIIVESRENSYRRQGIGCYMFRLDRDFTVDGTMKGSIARFINHSCEPNCRAKVVIYERRKHIVLIAAKWISKGEELLYDYKLPKEKEKIPCLCKSASCRGNLN